jgi:HEXXH motif-containing protein
VSGEDTPSTHDLLWRSPEVLRRRHEQTAVALIAVRRLLERERPLAGQESEFLALYERAFATDPDVFTRVWTDPTACFWVRIAYQLVANVVAGVQLSSAGADYCRESGGLEPRRALALQLSDFKRFSLALHQLDGSDVAFETPLRMKLPFALPGTRLSLEGSGELELAGLAGGELRVVRGGAERRLSLEPGEWDELRVVRCPVVEYGGCSLRLQPQLYANLTGLASVEPLVGLGAARQTDYVGLLQATLELVARHAPESFSSLREAIRVVALKPAADGDYTNVSHSDLPGALVLSAVNPPHELADALIHEVHHDRLFAVEELDPFFEDPAAAQHDARYYSPWRDDPRPLHGILHAVYVHLPVWHFWCDVHRCGGGDDPELEMYARDRLLRIALQLSIGSHQLRRHARFSLWGARVFSEILESVGRVQQQLSEILGDADVPAWVCDSQGRIRAERREGSAGEVSVRESVLEHVRVCAPEGQASDLRADVRN